MVLFRRAAGGEGVAAKLAGIAAHAADMGILVGLALVQCFSALLLGVTLYAITRDEDGDLAMLGLVCRVVEGVLAALSIPAMLTLFGLATASGADAPDTAAVHALAAYLLRDDVALTATFFAVGSTAFAYLLLRGRMIPVPLAWLGVVASAVLVVGLPPQLGDGCTARSRRLSGCRCWRSRCHWGCGYSPEASSITAIASTSIRYSGLDSVATPTRVSTGRLSGLMYLSVIDWAPCGGSRR